MADQLRCAEQTVDCQLSESGTVQVHDEHDGQLVDLQLPAGTQPGPAAAQPCQGPQSRSCPTPRQPPHSSPVPAMYRQLRGSGRLNDMCTRPHGCEANATGQSLVSRQLRSTASLNPPAAPSVVSRPGGEAPHAMATCQLCKLQMLWRSAC